MFGLIRKLGENQVAPAVSGGAPVAGSRSLLSQLTVPLDTLAMPSIAAEMAELEGQAMKPLAAEATLAWPEETSTLHLHHGVQVDEISQEEFDRHLALFAAGTRA